MPQNLNQSAVAKKHLTYLFILSFIMLNISCKQRSPFDFDDYSSYPVYNGDDLEMIYTPSETQFRVWAPTAEAVKVKIYENGIDGETVIEKK